MNTVSVATAMLRTTSVLAMCLGCTSSNGVSGGAPPAKDAGTEAHGDGGTAEDAPVVDGGLLPYVPDNLSISPVGSCTMDGIGATKLVADAAVTILDVST